MNGRRATHDDESLNISFGNKKIWTKPQVILPETSLEEVSKSFVTTETHHPATTDYGPS